MAREIMTPELSEEAQKCTLFNKSGEQLSFGQILDEQPSATRLLVIFIRHFFCGNCQEYIRRISSDFSPKTLPSDLSLVIIGCGAHSLISSYIGVTGCPFPIFSDPSAQLYNVLGMHRSLSLGRKDPAYIKHSLALGAVKSILQGIKRIPTGDVMQAGDMGINGGEILLEKTASLDWNISWSHHMRNTRDHTEIVDLKQILGLGGDFARSETSKTRVSI